MDIEIINILTALIKAQYQGSLVFGTNIPDNSLALLWRSNPQEIYMCKDGYNHMNVRLNGKNKDQEEICSTLNQLHYFLSKLKSNQIELGEHTQIIDIQTSSSPELIGVEENGQWIYGSSLLIKYYIK